MEYFQLLAECKKIDDEISKITHKTAWEIEGLKAAMNTKIGESTSKKSTLLREFKYQFRPTLCVTISLGEIDQNLRTVEFQIESVVNSKFAFETEGKTFLVGKIDYFDELFESLNEMKACPDDKLIRCLNAFGVIKKAEQHDDTKDVIAVVFKRKRIRDSAFLVKETTMTLLLRNEQNEWQCLDLGEVKV